MKIGGSLNDKDLRTAMQGLIQDVKRRAQLGAERAKPSDGTLATAIANQVGLQGQTIVRGWRIVASIDPVAGGGQVWHFSASLYPPGRSSTEGDWKVLGVVAGLSGAPPEALRQVADQVEGGFDPNRAHHWLWPVNGTDAERASVERTVAALPKLRLV